MRKKTFMATIGTALCMAACVGMLAACGANSGNEEMKTIPKKTRDKVSVIW